MSSVVKSNLISVQGKFLFAIHVPLFIIAQLHIVKLTIQCQQPLSKEGGRQRRFEIGAQRWPISELINSNFMFKVEFSGSHQQKWGHCSNGKM